MVVMTYMHCISKVIFLKYFNKIKILKKEYYLSLKKSSIVFISEIGLDEV